MTNEQREAIKICEHYKNILYACNYEEGPERVGKAIDTVLSLIKEQEKQIENTTENYKNLIEDISMLAKELGLEDDATIDEIYIAIKRLKQKDKQIDLIAEKINEAYCNETSFYIWFEKAFGIKPDGNYSKEIKQYFERKVEDVES